MSPAELSAIGKVLALTPAERPLGGVHFVPVSQYQALLKAAQALYAEATAEPIVVPVVSPVTKLKT